MDQEPTKIKIPLEVTVDLVEEVFHSKPKSPLKK